MGIVADFGYRIKEIITKESAGGAYWSLPELQSQLVVVRSHKGATERMAAASLAPS